MPPTLRRLRRLALAPAIIALAASCENSVSIEQDILAGSYTATSFIMIQSGTPYDVIGLGGSLQITIAPDSTMTGLLSFPAGIPNSTPGTASMAGKVISSSDLQFLFFDQAANTFIRQLAWQRFTNALVSTSFLGNTQFQITLRK